MCATVDVHLNFFQFCSIRFLQTILIYNPHQYKVFITLSTFTSASVPVLKKIIQATLFLVEDCALQEVLCVKSVGNGIPVLIISIFLNLCFPSWSKMFHIMNLVHNVILTLGHFHIEKIITIISY